MALTGSFETSLCEIVETFLGSFAYEPPRKLSVYIRLQFWCFFWFKHFGTYVFVIEVQLTLWLPTVHWQMKLDTWFIGFPPLVRCTFDSFVFDEDSSLFFCKWKNKSPMNFLKNSLFPTSFTNDAQERSAFRWQASPGGNLKRRGFEHGEVFGDMSSFDLNVFA